MALFRAMSTRNKSNGGYNRLLDETINDSAYFDADHQPVLKRTSSVPAIFGSSSKKQGLEIGGFPPPSNSNSKPKQGKKGGSKGKAHPLFSLFEGKGKKKKVTANPDFSRYIEYLKEGGMWIKDKDSPVIHYK